MGPKRDSAEDAHSGQGEQTRHHLIEAAQSLFAEHGFRGASIRDIASVAGTNIAAINYHFGNKENLYRIVFRRLAARFDATKLQAVRDVVGAGAGRPTVEAVLEAYALGWGRIAEEPAARQAEMLIAHELAQPRVGAEFLLQEFLEPVERELGDALELACPGVEPQTIQLCIHSLLAQLSHVNRLQLYLADVSPERVSLLASDEAIHHIVRFTSAGLRGLAEEDPTPPDTGGGS